MASPAVCGQFRPAHAWPRVQRQPVAERSRGRNANEEVRPRDAKAWRTRTTSTLGIESCWIEMENQAVPDLSRRHHLAPRRPVQHLLYGGVYFDNSGEDWLSSVDVFGFKLIFIKALQRLSFVRVKALYVAVYLDNGSEGIIVGSGPSEPLWTPGLRPGDGKRRALLVASLTITIGALRLQRERTEVKAAKRERTGVLFPT